MKKKRKHRSAIYLNEEQAMRFYSHYFRPNKRAFKLWAKEIGAAKEMPQGTRYSFYIMKKDVERMQHVFERAGCD